MLQRRSALLAPVPPATAALAAALVDEMDCDRFWDNVAHQGAIAARLRERHVYLRAKPVPGGNTFVVIDARTGRLSEVPVAQLRVWAEENGARVAPDHLPKYLRHFTDTLHLGPDLVAEVTAEDTETGELVVFLRPTRHPRLDTLELERHYASYSPVTEQSVAPVRVVVYTWSGLARLPCDPCIRGCCHSCLPRFVTR